MQNWDEKSAQIEIYNFDDFTEAEKRRILEKLNANFPPETFKTHDRLRKMALEYLERTREVLSTHKQKFPKCIDIADIPENPEELSSCAILLTAGGDGTRLLQSLREKGMKISDLENFTKATFPLKGFPKEYGALQINLALISDLCKRLGVDIPVIVSAGPENSQTGRVVPKILAKHNNFGLKNLRIIPQAERLHLTNDGKIVINQNTFMPYTNPDETGGPIMALKGDPLEWLKSLGTKKIILLQAIGLYNPAVITKMAVAASVYDAMALAVPRKDFSEKNSMFGSPVILEKDGAQHLVILEAQVINEETKKLTDKATGNFLPKNSGLYVFDLEIIKGKYLPGYASPDKEINHGMPSARRIGYAATDIVSLASSPAVLTISEDDYAVIKDMETVPEVEAVGERFGLKEFCIF